MRSLRLTKIVNEIKFEQIWAELEATNVFQKHLLTKYRILNLVFKWNSAQRAKFRFCFSRVSC